ncbi:MAG: hypothetical protein KME32_14435 [Mojavia pulchra JT2-VF2]|uniref:Uncharacterized protein n=1 Tax=Mojavia pulchra JT2-VF2 TaxID=287848 RepID=A0A951PY06_9NOST|nr:hypothetical protein [Mojavia pulchra JT2-VF2]
MNKSYVCTCLIVCPFLNEETIITLALHIVRSLYQESLFFIQHGGDR